jgi:hypothetical protein
MPAHAVIGKLINSNIAAKYLAVFRIILIILVIICDINLWPVYGGSDIPVPGKHLRTQFFQSASHGFN